MTTARRASSRRAAGPGTRATENDRAIAWLEGSDQPSIRYLTRTRLRGLPDADPAVREARRLIPTTGWASEILDRQLPNGAWAPDQKLYGPKYHSTNWMLLVLSDLGLTKEDPRIARGAEVWMERMGKPDGGFAPDGYGRGHLCTTGNTVRALLKFGYEDDRRVRAGIDWLLTAQDKLGGWSCYGRGRNLDGWEPMSAFAALPRARWTREVEAAVAKGGEFFLSRELHRQGAPYEPWDRFHYPVHYYYDLLVGLDFLTALGFAKDPRLGYALDRLRRSRRPDGRWNMDAVHPDVDGAIAEWIAAHPDDSPRPFQLEQVGAPSQMITLTAVAVLQRVAGPGPAGRAGRATS